MHADARQQQLVKLATWASILTAIFLIILKTWAWQTTASVSLLASLLDSLMDAAASIINFFAVRYAMIPADEDHRFGHGKAEALAGLAQAGLIGLSVIWLFVQSIDRILNPQAIVHTDIGIAIMLVSIVATAALVLGQRYVVERTQSNAVAADSLHYLSDLLMNASVIVALLLSVWGWQGADAWLAIVIGFYVLHSAWEIGIQSMHLLLDRELEEADRTLISNSVLQHEGVLGMHDLRTRQSGYTKFAQLHLELPDSMPLIEAHAIADAVEASIMNAIPNAEVIVHLDPISVVPNEDHAMMDRVVSIDTGEQEH
ncbi:MAG: cation diffusion facilitator family transporter [Gammaproteobacteria bacterium]|nr:cation diffusion facilitator family transporter [Gammaproteobacteria bacterium]